MNIPVNFIDEATQAPVSEPTTVSTFASVVEKTATPQPAKPRSRFSFKNTLTTLLTASVALLALALVSLKILGFRTFTVMSGSMEPSYPVGSLIYVKPTDPASLQPGDVISYVANSDKTVVTHRIISVLPDKKDSETLRFQTQGDANNLPDANLVHYKNVLGTPVLTVPYLGFIVYHLSSPPGIYITLVLGTLLLAWAFLPKTLEERRKTASRPI